MADQRDQRDQHGAGDRRSDKDRLLVAFYLHENVAGHLDRATNGVKLGFVENLATTLGLRRPTKDAYKCWRSAHWYQVEWLIPQHVVRGVSSLRDRVPHRFIPHAV
jgi:hypothetical protein